MQVVSTTALPSTAFLKALGILQHVAKIHVRQTA